MWASRRSGWRSWSADASSTWCTTTRRAARRRRRRLLPTGRKKDYCTGFAFEGEFVADFPYCLDGDVSEVTIEADMPCQVRIISGRELQRLIDTDPAMAKMDLKILKNLFKMVYARDLDHYRYTARGRYRRLLDRCPQVVQMLSLKDIASFLNITPSYLSTLRKGLTFGKEK